jgi:transcription antitermination protein NusB
MISRRNIRIKVLQALYSQISAQESLKDADTIKSFKLYCIQAEQLGVSYLQLTKQIFEYCIIEKSQRGAKYLPNAADLAVSERPAKNLILKELNDNISFAKAVENAQVYKIWDDDHLKTYYQLWKETEIYKNYITQDITTREEDKDCFLEVLEFLMQNEDIESLVEDRISSVTDDNELIALWIVKNFDVIPTINFTKTIDDDKISFGEELIRTFIDKFIVTAEMIKPKLLNWDSERIATIDMMLLQLGLCELLFFPTIPTKVTINEYIDIAKIYSTLQSGNFVNGVLDKIHKELLNDNKITKIQHNNA